MLLTTPLVVTVGLSLTIPLSLVAQIFLQDHYSSGLYWIGAAIVFLSFVVVNHESKADEEALAATSGGRNGAGYAPVSSEIDGEHEEIELDDEEAGSESSDREGRDSPSRN